MKAATPGGKALLLAATHTTKTTFITNTRRWHFMKAAAAPPLPLDAAAALRAPPSSTASWRHTRIHLHQSRSSSSRTTTTAKPHTHTNARIHNLTQHTRHHIHTKRTHTSDHTTYWPPPPPPNVLLPHMPRRTCSNQATATTNTTTTQTSTRPSSSSNSNSSSNNNNNNNNNCNISSITDTVITDAAATATADKRKQRAETTTTHTAPHQDASMRMHHNLTHHTIHHNPQYLHANLNNNNHHHYQQQRDQEKRFLDGSENVAQAIAAAEAAAAAGGSVHLRSTWRGHGAATAERLFARIPNPTAQHYNHMIDGHARLGDIDRAHHYYKTLLKRIDDEEEQARRLVIKQQRQQQQASIPPPGMKPADPSSTLDAAASASANDGAQVAQREEDRSAAAAAIADALQQQPPRQEETQDQSDKKTAATQAHASHQQQQQQQQQHRTFRQPPLAATAHTFTALIRVASRLNRRDLVDSYYAELCRRDVAPDVTLFHALLRCASRTGDMSRLEQWWTDMETANIEPDVIAVQILLSGYARIGAIDRMERAWNRAQKGLPILVGQQADGVNSSPSSPPSASATPAACAADKNQRENKGAAAMALKDHDARTPPLSRTATISPESAESPPGDLEDTDEQAGPRIRGDRVIFNTLLRGAAQAGRRDLVAEYLSSMRDEGLRPTVVTYNWLLQGMAKQDDMEALLQLFSEMTEDGGVMPNVVTFNSMLMCPSCSLADVGALQRAMTSLDIEPNEHTYALLLRHFIDDDGNEVDASVASGVTPAMDENDDNCHVPQKEVSCSEEEHFSSTALNRFIRTLPQDAVVQNRIAALLVHYGRREDAQHLLDLMSESGLTVQERTRQYVFQRKAVLSAAAKKARLLMREKQCAKAHQHLKKHVHGDASAITVWRELLRLIPQEKSQKTDKTAERCAIDMVELGVVDSTTALNLLLHALVKAGRWKHAVRVLNAAATRAQPWRPDTVSYNTLLHEAAIEVGNAKIKRGMRALALNRARSLFETMVAGGGAVADGGFTEFPLSTRPSSGKGSGGTIRDVTSRKEARTSLRAGAARTIVPDEASCCGVLRALAGFRTPDTAEHMCGVFDVMQAHGITPPPVTYQYLWKGTAAKQRETLAQYFEVSIDQVNNFLKARMGGGEEKARQKE